MRSCSALGAIVLTGILLSVVATGAHSAPKGTGAILDGETAYATEKGAVAVNPKALTVSAWVRLESIDESQVFANTGRADTGLTFYLFNKQVRMLVGNSATRYTYAVAPPPPAGTWTHYAGTYDGATVAVYMNGKLIERKDAPGEIQPKLAPLYLGSLDKRERFLAGALEDVCIWGAVLSDDAIAALAEGRDEAALGQNVIARWTAGGLKEGVWSSEGDAPVLAKQVAKRGILINEKDDGYRGIWYYNQPSNDEYVYKYSGGLGTYCAKHIPHAWYAPKVKKTFFTYGGSLKDDSTRLIHMVSYYDHKTGMVPKPTILLDKETNDAHDNPVINLDDKGYIWIFSSSHGTGRPSYISRSSKPYEIDSFELIWTGNFSYPQPWYFKDKGFLFMHTYYMNGGRTSCMMTSPDGATWGQRRVLSRIALGHYQISRPYADKKLGVAFNYHPEGRGLNWRTNLYYMESDDFGETWKAADGTALDIPLSEVTNPALVADYESQKLNVYMKDITYDSKGNPIILYVTSKGYESGPENMPRTWCTARWTGAEWDIHGGSIVSDNNYDTGLIYVERDDLWRIIGPTQVGPQPFNPGGEVAIWVSTDQGVSWTMTRQMTQNSDYNHTYVRRPVAADPGFCGFWADGHGRKPSDSRLYFCNSDGDVFRLPVVMTEDFQKPEKIN